MNTSRSFKGFDEADATAQRLSQAPREQRVPTSVLPLSKIIRRTEDSRPLNAAHVVALAETIAALGLIEPLVVDRHRRLLAGGHRLAAITLLEIADDGARLATLENLGGKSNFSAELATRVRNLHLDGNGTRVSPFENRFPGGLIPVHEKNIDAQVQHSRLRSRRTNTGEITIVPKSPSSSNA